MKLTKSWDTPVASPGRERARPARGDVDAHVLDRLRAAVAIANQVAAKSHDFMVAFVEETTKGAVAVDADGSETGSCVCS